MHGRVTRRRREKGQPAREGRRGRRRGGDGTKDNRGGENRPAGRDGKNKVVPAGRVAAISAKDTPTEIQGYRARPAHATLNFSRFSFSSLACCLPFLFLPFFCLASQYLLLLLLLLLLRLLLPPPSPHSYPCSRLPLFAGSRTSRSRGNDKMDARHRRQRHADPKCKGVREGQCREAGCQAISPAESSSSVQPRDEDARRCETPGCATCPVVGLSYFRAKNPQFYSGIQIPGAPTPENTTETRGLAKSCCNKNSPMLLASFLGGGRGRKVSGPQRRNWFRVSPPLPSLN